MTTLSGKQITLRDMTLDDLEPFGHWLHPGHKWQALDGPYYPKPSADAIPQILDRRRTAIEKGDHPTPRQRLIIADGKTDALVGMVSWYWISEETWWPALGIVIYDPDQWGKGIGYEAFGLWSDYLLREQPNFARLDLRTWSGNIGMMRLAEKLGYTLEARFRKARIVNGDYYDGLGYGILREEWHARYPDGFAASLD